MLIFFLNIGLGVVITTEKFLVQSQKGVDAPLQNSHSQGLLGNLHNQINYRCNVSCESSNSIIVEEQIQLGDAVRHVWSPYIPTSTPSPIPPELH